MDKVVHFEIPSENLERAIKFYKELFEWDINKVPMANGGEYHLVNTVKTDEKGMPLQPGAINGGILMKDSTAQYPIVTIKVADINDSMKKIKNSGGKIVMEKVPVGDFGLYARFQDTDGNILGLWQDVKKY